MSKQEQRARFEAWFAADTVPGSTGFFERDTSNPAEYAIFEVQCEWRSWQAAEAAAIERCAALIEPKNPRNDWTTYAETRAECAASIRALMKKEESNE